MPVAQLAPGVVEEIRYASHDNFTGAPVPGYEAARCLLTPRAAAALGKAQRAARAKGLHLKVFDCYRPRTAVEHFVRWSQQEGDGDDVRKDYLPRVRRKDTFRLGYLATRSAHSRGVAVDVTLVPKGATANAPRTQAPACNAAGNGGLRRGELDLGTDFDCLDPCAHTFNPNVSDDVKVRRALLGRIMQQAGFVGYHREWWHYTLADAGPKHEGFDEAVH